MAATRYVDIELLIDEISGRYDHKAVDLTPDSVIDAQNELVSRSAAAGATVIGLTEINNPARARASKWPGYTLNRNPSLQGGNSGDVGILTRDWVWKVVAAKTVVIGPDLGFGGQTCAQITVAEHKVTGVRVTFTISHLASGIEDNLARVDKDRLGRPVARRDWLVDAYVESTVKWRAATREMTTKYGSAHTLFMGDFNLDAHKAWVREMLAQLFVPRLVTPLPSGGTHAGDRLIDLFLVSSKIVLGATGSWKILPATPGATDHRAVRLRAKILHQQVRA